MAPISNVECTRVYVKLPRFRKTSVNEKRTEIVKLRWHGGAD